MSEALMSVSTLVLDGFFFNIQDWVGSPLFASDLRGKGGSILESILLVKLSFPLRTRNHF